MRVICYPPALKQFDRRTDRYHPDNRTCRHGARVNVCIARRCAGLRPRTVPSLPPAPCRSPMNANASSCRWAVPRWMHQASPGKRPILQMTGVIIVAFVSAGLAVEIEHALYGAISKKDWAEVPAMGCRPARDFGVFTMCVSNDYKHRRCPTCGMNMT